METIETLRYNTSMNHCKVTGCTRTDKLARKMCNKHYQQWYVKGKPTPHSRKDPNQKVVKPDYTELIMTNRQGEEVARTKIDHDDWKRVGKYRWYVNTTGYAVTVLNGVTFIHNYIYGDKKVDHINGDRLDNRRANLRKASPSQNSTNRKTRKNNKTGYKGVSQHGNKYKIQMGGKNHPIRVYGFSTPEEAASVYDQIAQQIYGEFAWTNFDWL